MQNFLKTKNLTNLKVLICSALFAAISIVLGKFLAISVGQTLRFSFENLPLILTGALFGPTVGTLTALASDILGCFLRGYELNPILTAAAALTGFLSGAVYSGIQKRSITVAALFTVITCHIVSSVIIKTIGLYVFYKTPFFVLLGTRVINYAVVIIAEFFVLKLLLSSKSFTSQIKKITGAAK